MQRAVTFDHIIYTVFPHIVSAETILFELGNSKVTVHKAKGHSTQMCGNYSREETLRGNTVCAA